MCPDAPYQRAQLAQRVAVGTRRYCALCAPSAVAHPMPNLPRPQAKAYTTRVGAGPYPTEIFGDLAEELREIGAEYGTTTGRPRRIGWLDLVALKFASR